MSLGRRYRPVDPRRVGGPIRPGGARLFVVGLGVVAVVAALLHPVQSAPLTCLSSDRSPPPPVTITYVFSTDAENLLERPINEFNQQRHKVNGHIVRVVPCPMASGEAEEAIRNGVKPVVWTPASSA